MTALTGTLQIKLVQDPTWEDVKAATSQPMTNGLLSAQSGSSSSEISPRDSQRGRKPSRRFRAVLRAVPRAETIAKKGHIYLMRTQDDGVDSGGEKWQKVWAVLRRPYLVLYTSSNEQEEMENVINVSTVRVDHSSQLEEVLSVRLFNRRPCGVVLIDLLGLQRRHAFGIYTPVAALFAAAQSFPEMLAWIQLIDPSWHRQA